VEWTYDGMRLIDPRLINGLIHELGTPAWEAAYDHGWQRDEACWAAVSAAFARASAGDPAGTESAPPRWLSTIVRHRLSRLSASSWGAGGFHRVRLLERLGMVSPEHDDTYVLAFVSGYPRRDPTVSCAPELRVDSELLDEVLWRLFEVEGGGEVSLTNIDRFFGQPWRRTFTDLVNGGDIPREQVLTCCLETLRRDFNHYRAGWFSATYLSFSPTTDELAGHQGLMRELLRSDVPATLSFALKLLQTVHKAGALEAAATLAALPAAATARAKGTALSVLRLAGSLAAGDQRAGAIAVARAALEHPHPDVQQAAARLLSSYDDDAHVRSQADELAPSVQAMLGVAVTEPMEAATAEPIRRPLPPAASQADVVERLSALLEDASDALEVEAVLAGLARLGDPAALSPLRKRAGVISRRAVEREPGLFAGELARLVLLVCGESSAERAVTLPQQRFVQRRLDEILESVRGERPHGPLLATPDLPGGWVAPETLVARLASLSAAPAHHDLIAALLRLHPDGRGDALSSAKALDGSPGAVVRAALGDPRRLPRRIPDAWRLAATVTREPLPASPARLEHSPRSHTYTDARGPHTVRWYDWSLAIAQPARRWPDGEPTLLRPADGWRPSLGDWVGQLAALWPRDAEFFLALTFDTVTRGTGSEREHDAVRVLDELARHPGRLGSMAALVLTAGLTNGYADQRLAAVDAFVDLVGTGRLPAAAVADAMAALSEGLTVSRWADSMQRAAGVPSAARAVVDVLTRLLPQLPPSTTGLAALLDVLHQETLRHGWPIDDPALRSWLTTLKGSARAATTARALLAR
jgi:hypothetical protein